MARNPYHIARQEHLGDMLYELQRRGRLEWRWEYDVPRSAAIYHVSVGGAPAAALDTKSAEQVAQEHCDALGIRWRPVPHPGGEQQRDVVREWMDMSD